MGCCFTNLNSDKIQDGESYMAEEIFKNLWMLAKFRIFRSLRIWSHILKMLKSYFENSRWWILGKLDIWGFLGCWLQIRQDGGSNMADALNQFTLIFLSIHLDIILLFYDLTNISFLNYILVYLGTIYLQVFTKSFFPLFILSLLSDQQKSANIWSSHFPRYHLHLRLGKSVTHVPHWSYEGYLDVHRYQRLRNVVLNSISSLIFERF